MVDESANDENGARVWKLATGLASIVAALAVVWGYMQSQQVARLQGNLQALATEADTKIKALTDEANTKLQALSKPDLPITARFGKPLLSNDLMATFRNNSATALEVAAVFTSPATGQTKQVTIVIPANGEKTILKGDGWEFAAGQTIKLSNNDYRTITFTVPQ